MDKTKNILFIIAYILLLAAVLVFFGFGKVSGTGWIIAILILVLSFFITLKISVKGCLTQGILWLITVILLFLVWMIVVPSGLKGNSASFDGNIENTAAPAGQDAQPETQNGGKPAFYIDYSSFSMHPGFEYADGSATEVNIAADGYIVLSLRGDPSSPDFVNDEVAKISMTVKPLKAPAYGKVKLFRIGSEGTLYSAPFTAAEAQKCTLPETFDLAVVNNQEPDETSERFYLAYDNFISGDQIRFWYSIRDIMPASFSTQNVDAWIAEANAKGINSDALRTTLSFDISIVTRNGGNHGIYFEQKMIPGDFFVNGSNLNIVEDYQNKQPRIVSEPVR